MSLVVDASTTLAAVLPDEESPLARAALAVALNDGLHVPTLWAYEIQNGIAMAMRRKRINAAQAGKALDALRTMGAEFSQPQGIGHEFRLAQAHALSAYDAAYLAVALVTGAQLATHDRRLQLAAQRCGITLFGFD